MAVKAKKETVLESVPISEPKERQFQMVLISTIRTGKNIRKEFREEEHQVLVESIRVNGVLEPLLVMHSDKSGEYTLIAGERRLRAATIAGKVDVPCFIYSPLTDSELYDIMITENLLRLDLNAIEEAEGFQKILDAGMSQEDLGKRVGKSQEYISNRLRLLDAPDILQKEIISREITPGHVIALLAMKNHACFESYVRFFIVYNEERKKEVGANLTVRYITEEDLLKKYFSSTGQENNGKLFLDLHGLEYTYGVSWRQLKCLDCKKRKEYGYYNQVCIDAECFPDILKEAKEALERKKKTDAKSLISTYDVDRWLAAKPDVAVPDKLAEIPFYKEGKYDFSDRPVSIKTCTNCEKCDYKKEICKDPACFKGKYKIAVKQMRATSKVIYHDVTKAIGDTIGALTDDELLTAIADHYKIYSREFEDVKKFFGSDVKTFSDLDRHWKLRFILGSWFRSRYAMTQITGCTDQTVKEYVNEAKSHGFPTDKFDAILKGLSE